MGILFRATRKERVWSELLLSGRQENGWFRRSGPGFDSTSNRLDGPALLSSDDAVQDLSRTPLRSGRRSSSSSPQKAAWRRPNAMQLRTRPEGSFDLGDRNHGSATPWTTWRIAHCRGCIGGGVGLFSCGFCGGRRTRFECVTSGGDKCATAIDVLLTIAMGEEAEVPQTNKPFR